MRTALALGVLGLVFAVSASGSTPSARILFNEAAGTSTDVVTLDADGTNYRNLTPGQATFYVRDTDGSWSPDGSRIAFTSQRDSNVGTEVYVMDADGSNPKRLTHVGPDGVQSSGGGVFAFDPEWSPLGDTIAYLKSVGGQWDIWLMKPDGSEQRALTADGGTKTLMSWSPDGTRIAYQRQDAMFVVAASGGQPVQLPKGYGPAWSPDGSRIAFGDGSGLWTVRPDGTGAERLTPLPAGNPTWSADGSSIAFLGIRYFPELANRFGIPSRQDVYVVHPDGSGQRRLTGPADDGFDYLTPSVSMPAWWPDGSRLFFTAARIQWEQPTTYMMNADGTCEGHFAATATQLLRPRWRPGSQPGLGPIRCADLRIRVALAGGAVAPAGLGQDAQYRLDIDNDGNEAATGVRLELTTTRAALTFGAGELACTGPKLDLTCPLPPIAPGAVRSVAITASSAVADNYSFTVSVAAVEPDSDPSTNTAASVLSVLPCTSVGSWGDDVMYGTPGNDRICSLTGRDEVYGGKGNDYLDSGNGSDIVAGGSGPDVIFSKGGNDTIYARDGERDIIDCGSERDIVLADRLDITRHCETVVRPKR
jgi:TolB protein